LNHLNTNLQYFIPPPSEFYRLYCDMMLLSSSDFNHSRKTVLKVDPRICRKRLRKLEFPPKHDITLEDRYSAHFCKKRLSALLVWWRAISEVESLFDFNVTCPSSKLLRKFLGIDYTLFLRKNDDWYIKDKSFLVNHNERNTWIRDSAPLVGNSDVESIIASRIHKKVYDDHAGQQNYDGEDEVCCKSSCDMNPLWWSSWCS
jgi:hypothetical protein